MVKKIFYLAMPVFLIAGLYTGLRIWYLLFLVQLFTLLLILAVDFFTVYTFRFTQTLSAEQATKGELAEIRLSIVNEKPFPLSMMEIEMETVSPDDRTSLRISLPPFGESSFTVPMTLPYRGVYPVGMTRVRITDFFGLLPFVFDMRRLPYYRCPKLTVFPLAELPGENAGLHPDSRDTTAHRDGDTPIGAREYRPGDPLRRIHWSKTAQMGKLFTRELESPRQQTIRFLLDNCLPDRSEEERRIQMDTLCEAAADLALLSIHAGYRVELSVTAALPGTTNQAEADDLRSFPTLHRLLAEVGIEKEKSLLAERLPEALRSGSLYLLTANADRELVRMLRETAEDVTLIQVSEHPVPQEGLPGGQLLPGSRARTGLEGWQ